MSVVGEPIDVPPGLSLCAYRVVQEALTNTIKHAGAARAEVLVRWHEDVLELEVADDGRGPAPRRRLGRAVTASSACVSGRRCTVAGSRPGRLPGGGFAVRARIPLAGVATP